MESKPCSKCGATIAVDAVTCPNCGIPTTRRPVDRAELALVSLITGIVSIPASLTCPLFILLGLLALLFGQLGLQSRRKPMAVMGITLAIIGIALTIALQIWVATHQKSRT